MGASTSIFAGLTEAKVSETGRYLEANYRYKLEILDCKVITPRSGPPAYVVDFKVLESNCPNISMGEIRNWYQQKNDSFDSALFEFVCAAAGCNPHDKAHEEYINANIRPRVIEIATASVEAAFFKGRNVIVETQGKATKSGGDFTKHNWYPAPVAA